MTSSHEKCCELQFLAWLTCAAQSPFRDDNRALAIRDQLLLELHSLDICRQSAIKHGLLFFGTPFQLARSIIPFCADCCEGR